MDRRSFLKMLVAVPFTKEIAKSFIEPNKPEPVEEFVVDWRDSINDDAMGLPMPDGDTPPVQKMYVHANSGLYYATRDAGFTWIIVENEEHAKDFLDL